MLNMEAALAAVEADADAALGASTALVRELKKVKATAAAGHLRDLRRSLEGAEQLSRQVAASARALREGWTLDEQEHFACGAYSKELVELAQREGLQLLEQDERLLCYPSVVRIVLADQTVEIDKKKHRSVRPTTITRILKSAQMKQPRFKAEAFLAALERAYELVISRDCKMFNATVKIVDVYEVLTLMPGQSKEYTKQEFARDLYLLDQSGVTTGKSGREMRLPASTLTKGSGVLMTVTRGGQQKLYAGISFS